MTFQKYFQADGWTVFLDGYWKDVFIVHWYKVGMNDFPKILKIFPGERVDGISGWILEGPVYCSLQCTGIK